MPTSFSNSTTRRRVEAARPPCRAMISPICFSMVWSGLSEVIGSWNTMVTPAPRIARSSASLILSTSRPLKKISPVGWLAAG